MSVTLAREHDPDDFAELIAELQAHPIPINHDRRVAGKGRSQAFGVIRRWSYRPWLSRNTWMRPILWKLLLAFAESFVTIEWDAIQVNDNYQSAPHRDKGNCGVSYIVSFGDFTGGELVVEGNTYDIRHRAFLFNGSELLHRTNPWSGSRYSLVFYRIEWPNKWPIYSVTCRVLEDGVEVSDEYDQSVTVLDRKGHIVRIPQQGVPMPWIGRLTSRGQKSQNSAIEQLMESAFSDISNQVFHASP